MWIEDSHPRTYDAVVDAAGGGDYTTLQAADDELDGGAYTVYVKAGTYAAGLTVSTNDALWVFEAGVIIQAACTLSGANVGWLCGPGFDLQAALTVSGTDGYIQCMNDADFGGVAFNGNEGMFDGGGHGTLVNGGTGNGFSGTGADITVKNAAALCTAGGGNNVDAILVQGVRWHVRNVLVVDSDRFGIATVAADVDIQGCTILGADTTGIQISGARARVIGNHIANAGGDGINGSAASDDSVIANNRIQDQTGDSIELTAAGDDVVVSGNRLDGAINDGSTGSTLTGNDTSAF
tara:strand:+ start:5613 stop:6494 length:882 start_codon:yes stop_codon:yes gene_type:complete